MTSQHFSANGNGMIADAMRQVDPDVMAAYPITPQTTIVEAYAKFVADGKVHTEYVPVESEHSALSACIGASAAGARVATATSSQGLAYMWEELPIAAGMRCPIVMANANRAISAPINIHGDHSDSMSARDTGWLMFYAETAQEAYDNTIIAFKCAEDENILLPAMVCLDGFVTTHAMERCVLEDDSTVKYYVGEYEPLYPLLDTEHPVSHGMYANIGDMYMRHHLTTRRVLEGAAPIIEKHGKEWEKLTGRPFELVDAWGCEDADHIIVVVGSAAGNARHAARILREQGRKVGVVRPRVYRPFPAQQVVDACKGAKAVAVLNRSDAPGAQHGPVCEDVMSAFYTAGLNIPVNDYIVGLGGADISLDLMVQVYDELEQRVAGEYTTDIAYLGIEE
ncbi:MAG: pyruvate ferredoxin oxidoreductase [Eggerthellales bacterium]|nr:pyruvate ferredoxin oxidoreductase [Eggerthellales bacterium]